MASPEHRWQLLLMADDGRIIPFRRVKAVALLFLFFLLVLGVVAAVLGWLLAEEKERHRQTAGRLTEVRSQVDRWKNENESTAALLSPEQSRGKKTELSEAQQIEPDLLRAPVSAVNTVPETDAGAVDNEQEENVVATKIPTDEVLPKVSPKSATLPDVSEKPLVESPLASEPTQPSLPSAKTTADPSEHTFTQAAPVAESVPPVSPAVVLSDLKITFDPGNNMLKARFRIKNSGPRSSQVKGRCVVILKPDTANPDKWLVMPRVTLVDGMPTGKKGSRFSISRYMYLTVKAVWQMDPSEFKTAQVYVFDGSGELIVEKNYPVDLPAHE